MNDENSINNESDSHKPTAFERWEMPALLEQQEIDQQASLVKQLPTLEEIEKIRADAYEEGFNSGKVKGLKAGEKLTQKKVASLVQSFNQPLQEKDDRLERVLLDMTLQLSKAIIHRELSIDSDAVNEIIREVFELVDMEEGKFRVQLNPQDIKRVAYFLEKEYATDAKYQLITDDKIKQGGCIIRSDAHYVDAQVETRIDKMLEEVYSQQDCAAVEILENQPGPIANSDAKVLDHRTENIPNKDIPSNPTVENSAGLDSPPKSELESDDSQGGVMSPSEADQATKVDLSDMPFFDAGNEEP